MNKIVASLGLVALGASSIQSVCAQDSSKFWNVSATLRGFYDDNRLTVPDGHPQKMDSYGFQVSPALGLNWANNGTSVQLGYVYSLKWYDEDFGSGVDDTDSTHTFRAGLNHAFTERYRLSLNDSFVIGQEPDSLRGEGDVIGVPFRAEGDNIRNYAAVAFDADITPLFGLTLGYNNGYFDYEDDSPGGLSERLDRTEHTGTVMGRWQALPETEAQLGYKYRMVDFDESDITDRDRQSHIVFVGASHNFRPDLRGAVQVGVEFAEFDSSDDDETSPYANANLMYTYLPESFIQVGVSHQRSATDVSDGVMDTETTLFYGHVRHRIVPRLFADASGQIQHASFAGGAFDGENETFYLLGLQLEYELNNYLSAHVGYNYDNLSSDIGGRDYDRNRVYIGVTARY